MSNESNNLVIFEYTPFVKRLYDCARSLPSNWSTAINDCLSKHKGEKNLEKLVDGLAQETRRYDSAVEAWNEISNGLAKNRNTTDSLIQQFKHRNLLRSADEPNVWIIEVLGVLLLRLRELIYEERERLPTDYSERVMRSKIYYGLASLMKELEQDPVFDGLIKRLDSFSDEDVSMAQLDDLLDEDAKHIDLPLQNLRRTFHEELEYVAKNNITDNIFQDVKKIANDIKSDIVKILGLFVGNEKFESDLTNYLNELDARIKKFTMEAQSNIDEQIAEAIDQLKESFNDELVYKINPEIQQISTHLGLYADTERHLSEVSKNIKESEDRIETFIKEFFQLPDDVEQSCKCFRDDFKCLDTLKKYEQNQDLPPEEVVVLKHLFGVYGTDVSERLNFISEDINELANHAWQIDEEYSWRSRQHSGESDDELTYIFEHAVTRLEHIYADLKGKLNE